jgi:hypothetical protein
MEDPDVFSFSDLASPNGLQDIISRYAGIFLIIKGKPGNAEIETRAG